ncbi:MAG: hypothetical protein M1812_006650 [Candelaria pacifica]|nr:MAG: hypothetical protein M1812_006650 [Candelaria pacifica]
MLKNMVASVPQIVVGFTLILPMVSSTPLSTRAIGQEQTAALNLHNNARAEHCQPPNSCVLQWDPTLEQQAKAWAEHLAQIGTDITTASHSTSDQRPGEGENLSEWWSSQAGAVPPLSQAVQGWLNEESNYHGEAIGQGDFQSYGHYTQCVWKSTTKVGMAKAQAANGKWFTVARYSPPGNYVGQKPY